VAGLGVQPVDWLAVAPVLVTAVAAVLVLLCSAFAGRPRTMAAALVPSTLTVVGLVAAAVTAVPRWHDPAATFCVQRVLDRPVSCSFVVDRLTLTFWGVALFGSVVVALLATALDGRTPMGEWCFLLLCSTTGALTLAAARDLVTLVVALEVVSLPAFAMVGLRRDDPRAGEAAVKFFLVSVVSTAVTLLGISLLYGATRTVFLREVAASLATGLPDAVERVAVVGALLTLVGLAFKVAAVPFHMWVPDTYAGSWVPVAAYLSVVSKSSGFAGLVLVLGVALPGRADVWAPVLGVVAALTMTVGNLLALRQRHAVRLLAWSSVAHAGYLLVPFAAAADEGTAALSATLGYLVVYAVMNLGAFAVAALVATRHPDQRLTDYRGLVREEPGAGWALALALVALAGLPPGVVGLVAKVVVIDVAAGPATWLAVVLAVNVVIGLVYYAGWLLELFRPAAEPGSSTYDVPTGVAVAIGMTATATAAFSVLPGLLLDPVMAVLS
jgi:NADH-quinone oxidoreductase subunit N